VTRFLPRDAMLARYLPSCVRLSVRRPYVSLKPIRYNTRCYFNVRSKVTQVSLIYHRYCVETKNRAGFYSMHCVIRKCGHLQQQEYFLLELCPKLRTWKISPRQVDLVVSKTCRRWSLLTTPMTADASVNCNPLTPSLRFVADLWYKLFRKSCMRFRLI